MSKYVHGESENNTIKNKFNGGSGMVSTGQNGGSLYG